MFQAINEMIATKQRRGNFLTIFDTIYCQSDTCHAFVYTGERYVLGRFYVNPSDQAVLEESDISRVKTSKQAVDSVSMDGYFGVLVRHYAQHGFPFALAKLDSIHFDDLKLSGNLSIDKGPIFHFDSIVNRGNLKINKKFFNRFLDIALSSSYELETQLILMNDLFDIGSDKLMNELTELQKMIIGFKNSLK